jgi:Uncharacterised nucleotidyltransferase
MPSQRDMPNWDVMHTERPEDQLLIMVARRSLDIAGAERLRSLVSRDLDWEYLLATAHRHGVLPLLYYHLNSVCPTLVPQRAMNRLKVDNHENTKSNLFLTAELLRLLSLFESQGIRAIPFKGPTLALSAYGDVALRQFSDLDIFVHKRDVLAVKELLIGQGFEPYVELNNTQETALLLHGNAYGFGCDDTKVWLDVHWAFVRRYFCYELDVDLLWDRLETITVGRQQLLTLPPEDLLSVLSVHASKHLWQRLGWISDIAGLVERRKNIDWQLVLENAAMLGTRRMLSIGLFLAKELLNAPIPEDVGKTVKADRGAITLAEELHQRLFMERNAPPGHFESALLHTRMRERKEDRLRFWIRLTGTTTVYDWTFVPLPDWLFFLYYPLRPLRLAGKQVMKLLKSSSS